MAIDLKSKCNGQVSAYAEILSISKGNAEPLLNSTAAWRLKSEILQEADMDQHENLAHMRLYKLFQCQLRNSITGIERKVLIVPDHLDVVADSIIFPYHSRKEKL